MNIEKALHYNRLFDFYDKLLTENQRVVFQYYFHDDLSYQEIADILNISRSGVYDTLKRTMNLLDDYEEKIEVVKRYQKLIDELHQLEDKKVNEILDKFEIGGKYE